MTISPDPALQTYTLRMNRVLDHIDRHLDAPLDLAALAEIAHYSPFHFHRIFTAWLGESAAEYVTRRRLEIGALALASQPGHTVTQVSQQVGFGSPEAFARAFKRHFGQTPSAWQKGTPERWAALLQQRRLQDRKLDQDEGKLDQAARPAGRHDAGSFNKELETMMSVSIQTLPAVRVAYFRRMGAYGPQIGQFWAETVRPWIAAQGLQESFCYGVGWDDPKLTAPAKCRYDACVALPDGYTPPSQVNLQELPGGRYAVAAFQGSGAEVAAAWQWLITDWFPRSGQQLDMRPFFERMSASTRPDSQTGAFACELCLPIQGR
ncbi:GyrI-like domain-containing protein [Paucibacter sp. APW11]|uniref:GyrI-like domain-containing protein n=1 Tax=Roseateles aquae TaxID=3077235 RepID=A0ABU3PB93_9BURK|nr:GyrI-like domain-containing protein [Paucibacter sp. APW11]MDT8999383.1 GyrI-like domain-containing protein [Paucibacter sp. APW11]